MPTQRLGAQIGLLIGLIVILIHAVPPRVGQRCPRSQGHICETGICAGAEHSDDGYDTCRIAGGSECSSDSQCESDLCRNFVCIS